MRPKPRRRIFLRCQRSFPSSAFFQAVTLRFCCRAAESRPRAPLLVTISLYRLSDQAARVNCSSAVDFVPPFKESEATPVARSSLRSRRRNRSAPDRHCSVAVNSAARNVSRYPKTTGGVRQRTIRRWSEDRVHRCRIGGRPQLSGQIASMICGLEGCCAEGIRSRAGRSVHEALKERNHVRDRRLSGLHVINAIHQLFCCLIVAHSDIHRSQFSRC